MAGVSGRMRPMGFVVARSCWRPLAGKETGGELVVHPWTCARLTARL